VENIRQSHNLAIKKAASEEAAQDDSYAGETAAPFLMSLTYVVSNCFPADAHDTSVRTATAYKMFRAFLVIVSAC